MNKNYIFGMLLLSGTFLMAGCGTGTSTSSTTQKVENDNPAADDEGLKEKMQLCVAAINAINTPLNKGYQYYLNYADAATGEPINKHSGIYFMPAISDAEEKLTALEKVAGQDPPSSIDAYIAEYATRARAALLLHNELAAYYGSKAHLTDNYAKGRSVHKSYVDAMEGFKPVGKQMADAYDKYYKEGNQQYLAKLEKDGDKIRLAANRLMNEAESLEQVFFEAIPRSGKLSITPELEAVMQRTTTLQNLIANFNTSVSSASEEDKKRFFNAGIVSTSIESSASQMLTSIRSGIDKIRKGDPGADNDLKDVSRYYDRMITDFNMGKF